MARLDDSLISGNSSIPPLHGPTSLPTRHTGGAANGSSDDTRREVSGEPISSGNGEEVRGERSRRSGAIRAGAGELEDGTVSVSELDNVQVYAKQL